MQTYSNYGSILHYFRDKVRYWSKIVIFFIPPLSFDVPVMRGPRRSIAISFGMGKWWGLYPTLKKNVDNMFSHFDRIPVTDGKRGTDGQTDILYGIVRAMHTRRAVKN